MTSKIIGLERESMIRFREPKAGDNNLEKDCLSKTTVKGKGREDEGKRSVRCLLARPDIG